MSSRIVFESQTSGRCNLTFHLNTLFWTQFLEFSLKLFPILHCSSISIFFKRCQFRILIPLHFCKIPRSSRLLDVSTNLYFIFLFSNSLYSELCVVQSAVATVNIFSYRRVFSFPLSTVWILGNSINLSLHLSNQSATESVLQFYLRSNLPIKVCSLYWQSKLHPLWGSIYPPTHLVDCAI